MERQREGVGKEKVIVCMVNLNLKTVQYSEFYKSMVSLKGQRVSRQTEHKRIASGREQLWRDEREVG